MKRKMNKEDKIKNILVFLIIIFGEDRALMNALMKIHPDYLIEKYESYVESNSIKHPWGLHYNFMNELFDGYCQKWMKDDE